MSICEGIGKLFVTLDPHKSLINSDTLELMNKRYSLAFVLPWLLMLLSGCNNDVFLDEPQMPDDLSATIEGDGGETVFTIPTNGLEHISFDLLSESKKYCTYFNHSGSIIDSNSPASEVAKIVYETDFSKREIIHNGTQLIVRSICSTSDYDLKVGIRLDYSYTVKIIHVNILPGRPLVLENVEYNQNPLLTESTLVKTHTIQINNQSESEKDWEDYPYINALGEILVEPDRYSSWLNYDYLPIEVPVYDDGKWTWQIKDQLKANVKYTYRRPDYMHKVTMTIPAKTVVRIYTYVTYVQAKASGVLTYLNEILNRRIIVNFNITSIYPVSYDIRIEEVH